MNKGISLGFKFRCYGNPNENNWPLLKNKRLLFSHNKKSISPIFLQDLTLPAVTNCIVSNYCLNITCLNNRPFVFSILDNHFDFG